MEKGGSNAWSLHRSLEEGLRIGFEAFDGRNAFHIAVAVLKFFFSLGCGCMLTNSQLTRRASLNRSGTVCMSSELYFQVLS